MPSPLDIALFVTAVSLTGWLVVPRLAGHFQSASKRRRFRSYLDLIRMDVESKSGRTLAFDLGPRDADRFQTEVLEVRDHIGKHLLVRFDAACATYRNVHFMDAHDCDKYNDKSKADLFTVLKEIYDCTLQARPVA